MESKELLDYLGIEATTIEEFTAGFKQKYFTEKQIHDDKSLLAKFTGKTITKIKQNILNEAREAEIPFTQSEFDDTPIEEVYKTLRTRQTELAQGKIEELKGQIGKSGEEAVKPFQERLTKYEQSLADEKKAKAEIALQFDQFKKESEGQLKATRVQYYRKDLTSEIENQFDPIAKKDELKMKGWNSHINENFKFDYDENDKPIITDKTGSKIKNPKKADEWLSPKEVLQAEADKLGLIPKNPQAGKPAYQGQPAPATNQPVMPAKPGGVRLAPSMEQYRSK